jgi:uncharacterized protein
VAIVSELGRNLIVPDIVLAEVDYLLRLGTSLDAARGFLAAIAAGEHDIAYLTPALLRRAVEFDRSYAGLNLGLVDAAVMSIAERERLPIVTFDFAHFRATRPAHGFWRLVVDERQFEKATGGRS